MGETRSSRKVTLSILQNRDRKRNCFQTQPKTPRISNEAPIIRNDVHVVPETASTRNVEMQRASSSNSSSSDAVMPQQPPQQSPPQPAAAAAPRNAMPQSAAIFQPRSCLKRPNIVTRSGRQIKPPVRFSDYVAK